jgi:hypothetical protein
MELLLFFTLCKLPCFGILFMCVYFVFFTRTYFVIGFWAVKLERR